MPYPADSLADIWLKKAKIRNAIAQTSIPPFCILEVTNSSPDLPNLILETTIDFNRAYVKRWIMAEFVLDVKAIYEINPSERTCVDITNSIAAEINAELWSQRKVGTKNLLDWLELCGFTVFYGEDQ